MIRKLFTVYFLFLFCHGLNAQDYEEFDTLSRNDFVIHASGGFGFYHLIHNDSNSETRITASRIGNIGVSYFLSNRIIVGFSFSRLTFAANKDSAESARTNLTAISLKYLTLSSKKSNIYIGITGGTSTFKFKNIKTNTNVTAGSLFLEPNIGFTHYWGKHVGIFVQSSYFYTKYDKIVNKENEPLRVTVNGKQEIFWLAFSGIKIQTGLLLKF